MRTISWPFGAYIPTRVLRPTRLKASSILLRYPKSFPGATIFLMAFAGVARIFSFLDEEPETDDGYVMLINAQETNGVLSEASEHTRLWAWKHPHLFYMVFLCMQSLVRKSPLSAQQVQVRQLSPTSLIVFTILLMVKSDMTVSTLIKLKRLICVAVLEFFAGRQPFYRNSYGEYPLRQP